MIPRQKCHKLRRYCRIRPSRSPPHIRGALVAVALEFLDSRKDPIVHLRLVLSKLETSFAVRDYCRSGARAPQMTRAASKKLTPEAARELYQGAGSKAYIAGSVGGLGSQYLLGLKAVNCQSRDAPASKLGLKSIFIIVWRIMLNRFHICKLFKSC